MIRLELADGPTIDVDDSREWLLRSALGCYRTECEKYARQARNSSAITRSLPRAVEQQREAQAWEQTLERIDAFLEEMN